MAADEPHSLAWWDERWYPRLLAVALAFGVVVCGLQLLAGHYVFAAVNLLVVFIIGWALGSALARRGT